MHPATAHLGHRRRASHTGDPKITLTKTGALPAGVTFVNNGDCTATLSGTPARAGAGTTTVVAVALPTDEADLNAIPDGGPEVPTVIVVALEVLEPVPFVAVSVTL
jgi:hypothetical protein